MFFKSRTKIGSRLNDDQVIARWLFVLFALLALASPIFFAQLSEASVSQCAEVFSQSPRDSFLDDRSIERFKRWNYSVEQKPMTLEAWLEDVSHYIRDASMLAKLESVDVKRASDLAEKFANVSFSGGRFRDVLNPWIKNPLLSAQRLSQRSQTEDKIRLSTLDLLNELPEFKTDTEVTTALENWYSKSGLRSVVATSKNVNHPIRSIQKLEPAQSASDLKAYEKMIPNSVEIFFSPTGTYGHTTLRVGKRFFSLDDVNEAKIFDYSPRFGTKGKVSFLFRESVEKIENALKSIEDVYASSRDFNLPPYELFSGLLPIKNKDIVKARSVSPSLGNREEIRAEVVDINGQMSLKTPLLQMPVKKLNDQLFIESYSCSTIVSHVLREKFGIEIGDALPIGLTESLMIGNPEGQTPSAIVYFD